MYACVCHTVCVCVCACVCVLIVCVLVSEGVKEGRGKWERESCNCVGKKSGWQALEQRARVCDGQCSGSARDLRVPFARDLSACMHPEHLGYMIDAARHIFLRVVSHVRTKHMHTHCVSTLFGHALMDVSIRVTNLTVSCHKCDRVISYVLI